jgi:hypothetical protein
MKHYLIGSGVMGPQQKTTGLSLLVPVLDGGRGCFSDNPRQKPPDGARFFAYCLDLPSSSSADAVGITKFSVFWNVDSLRTPLTLDNYP